MRSRIYDVIDLAGPEDRHGAVYDRFMLVCILVSLLPLCFKQDHPVFFWVDRVTVFVFIADYLLRWATADHKFPRRSKAAAFLGYPFTPLAILDLLSILPSLYAVNASLRLFRLSRLSRPLRTFRILRHSKSFQRVFTVVRRERATLGAVCVLAVSYILLSALLLFQVEPALFDSFFDAVYWSAITLTTVGYGDIVPTTVVGRMVCMVSSFVGIAIVALPTGILSAGYMRQLNREEE